MSASGERRRASIATKHGKERQLGPVLRRRLGWQVVVADVDTDQLGTFTGDVTRTLGAEATVRRKARWGMEATGARCGIATEATYGPHPDVAFLTVHEELAACLDDDESIEVVERLVTTDVVNGRLEVAAPEVPEGFLRSVGFGRHALVVAGPDGASPIAKGIVERTALRAAVAACLEVHPTAIVASDLRAHVNPTRQRVLGELAEALAERLSTRCPACGAPGWGTVDIERGRPCGSCGGPTPAISAHVLACAHHRCDHRARRSVDEALDPMWCPRCNP